MCQYMLAQMLKQCVVTAAVVTVCWSHELYVHAVLILDVHCICRHAAAALCRRP